VIKSKKEYFNIVIDKFKNIDDHYSVLELYGDGWFLDQENDLVHICDPIQFINFDEHSLDGFVCEFYDNPNIHWTPKSESTGKCNKCGALAPAILRVKLLLEKV